MGKKVLEKILKFIYCEKGYEDFGTADFALKVFEVKKNRGFLNLRMDDSKVGHPDDLIMIRQRSIDQTSTIAIGAMESWRCRAHRWQLAPNCLTGVGDLV